MARKTKTPATPTFQMYDVLQIDWQTGNGWQDFSTLKSEDEYREAVRIVRGGTCYAMPHWTPRTAVLFRIVSDRNEVKVSQ